MSLKKRSKNQNFFEGNNFLSLKNVFNIIGMTLLQTSEIYGLGRNNFSRYNSFLSNMQCLILMVRHQVE